MRGTVQRGAELQAQTSPEGEESALLTAGTSQSSHQLFPSTYGKCIPTSHDLKC